MNKNHKPFIENLEEIRSHETLPSPSSWNRIKDKTSKRRAKRKIKLYQKLSIAASFIALVAVGTLLNHNMDHKKHGDVFATNDLYSPVILEELSTKLDNDFYSVDLVNHLRKSYDMLRPYSEIKPQSEL